MLLGVGCNPVNTEDLPVVDTAQKKEVFTTTQVSNDQEPLGKAQISKADSSFWIGGQKDDKYKIFGYAAPDLKSNKLILFSVFTKDIAGNPNNCLLGAYYNTLQLENEQIKYVGDAKNDFVKTLFSNSTRSTEVYFKKSQIEFVD